MNFSIKNILCCVNSGNIQQLLTVVQWQNSPEKSGLESLFNKSKGLRLYEKITQT